MKRKSKPKTKTKKQHLKNMLYIDGLIHKLPDKFNGTLSEALRDLADYMELPTKKHRKPDKVEKMRSGFLQTLRHGAWHYLYNSWLNTKRQGGRTFAVSLITSRLSKSGNWKTTTKGIKYK